MVAPVVVMEEETTAEMVGGVTSVGAVTERVKEVVLLSVPEVPDTVMVESPTEVVPRVVMVRVVVQVRLHDVGAKLTEAPAGKPVAANETLADVPETRVEVMVLVTELP